MIMANMPVCTNPCKMAIEKNHHSVVSRSLRDCVCKNTVLILFAVLFTIRAFGQAPPAYTPPPPPPPASQPGPPPPPPGRRHTQKELESLVSRIALYPDPLLAQILTASTYPDEIPEAAEWANQHSYLTRDALANAIREDNLPWDPSVIALVPFPSVLNMMAQDPTWAQQLGNAVLIEREDVMDAAQRLRKQAYKYGYLRTSPYDTVVNSGGYIEILPVNPAYIYVPTYDPLVVFGPPAPGFFIGGAIRFGPAIVVGGEFAPWGWAHPYFSWSSHGIFFDATPWGRVWANRGFYVHPYEHPWLHGPGPRIERHEFRR
jgi:hypothetical protein